MGEFRLPDNMRDLEALEAELNEEFNKKTLEFQLVRDNLPAGVSSRKTPAFFSLLVAHRKWQFAYEKKKRLQRSKA